MKLFLSLLLLTGFVSVKGQTTKDSVIAVFRSKIPADDSAFRDYDNFRIKYLFNKFGYWDTMVGRMICDSGGVNCREDTAGYRMNLHYNALIFVYKDNILIGDPFDGIYVPATCFEDVPEQEVKHAQSLQKNKP